MLSFLKVYLTLKFLNQLNWQYHEIIHLYDAFQVESSPQVSPYHYKQISFRSRVFQKNSKFQIDFSKYPCSLDQKFDAFYRKNHKGNRTCFQ